MWLGSEPTALDHSATLVFEQVDGKVITDIGKSAVNEEMENCKCDNALRYDINGKPYVYYHRLQDPAGFDTHEVITGCWKEEGNKVNADIWLFSTEAELSTVSARVLKPTHKPA